MSAERLLEMLAYNLYSATVVGNPAPKVRDLQQRMIAPQVGDLVVEISTIWHEDRVGTRIGRLAHVAQEPMYTPEQWEDESEPIPLERVWYLALPDGREFRWVNASFIAVPTMLDGYQVAFVSDGDILVATPTPPETP